MKSPLSVFAGLALVLASAASAEDAARAAPPVGLGVAGAAVPGGAVLSSAHVALVPAAGGSGVAAPLAGDGSFAMRGLAPGRYRLALKSGAVPKQTQGATFGEKVNAGLHSAGSAVASGAKVPKTKHDTAKNSIGNVRAREAGPSGPAAPADGAKVGVDGGMPNRLSMNVTVAKRSHTVELDGADVEVEVGDDGTLAGQVTPR